jgi:hypothetical protein
MEDGFTFFGGAIGKRKKRSVAKIDVRLPGNTFRGLPSRVWSQMWTGGKRATRLEGAE